MKNNSVVMEEFARWYRRGVHAFGAVFLIYYILPDIDWINVTKKLVVVLLVTIFAIIEFMRIRNLIKKHFLFGLRNYEYSRFGSYIYFGIGAVLLLLFFPQQISIPCLLSAAFVDPLVGELRRKISKISSYTLGFLSSFFLFLMVWYNAILPFPIIIPIVGASGVILGEVKKYRWIDDDFLMQIIPALAIGVIYVSMILLGVHNILPGDVIYPLPKPWWLS